jgi:hypothetical protein
MKTSKNIFFGAFHTVRRQRGRLPALLTHSGISQNTAMKMVHYLLPLLRPDFVGYITSPRFRGLN